MNKKNLIAISILIITLIISIASYFLKEDKYRRLSFKFYYELENKIVIEDRYVLLTGDINEDATIVIDELFLGPISVFNKKLVPFDFKYNLFYIRNDIAYLDLPLTIVTGFSEENYTINDLLELIEINILDNIKKINSVIITIDGETPGYGPSKKLLPQNE